MENNIRERRGQLGITLKRLSDLTGISVSHLSEMERGIKEINSKRIEQISKALDFQIEWKNVDPTNRDQPHFMGKSDRILMGQRVQSLLEKRNLDADELARISETPVEEINQLLTAESTGIQASSLFKIAIALDVDPHYLRHGEKTVRTGRPHGVIGGPRTVYIPRYRLQLSAGPGAEIFDEVPAGLIPFAEDFFSKKLGRDDAEDLFIFDVRGDSMEPIIPNGSLVMIDARDRVANGAVMAFRFGDEAYIKRLHRVPGGFEAASENPGAAESRQALSPHGDEEFQIFGRVCWVAHSM